MKDRFTKMLLCAIALGLWANVITAWLPPVQAQDTADVWSVLTEIQSDVSSISSGLCLNSKIC